MSIDDIDTTVLRGVRNDRRPDALTDEGKRYLRQALDPYHDFNVGNTGVPSLNSGATYCRNIRLTRSIAYPTGTSPTGAWDLHIMTTPAYCQQSATTFTSTLGGVGTIASPYTVSNGLGTGFALDQISHVCYAWAPTGSTMGILDSAALWYALPIGSPDWGAYRIVSSGFEVHNTTPELYRSGSVTTWRSNPQVELTAVKFNGDTARNFAVCRSYQGIPATLALANQMATSRTWEAAAGAYVVSAPDYDDLAFKAYDEGAVVIKTGAVSAVGSTTRSSIIVGGLINPQAPFNTSTLVYRSGIVPAGAVFSGLDPASTFRLDCRVLVEISPDLSSNDLSLAGQPTTSDPVALELAALAFSRLPSGVPVGSNAAGDWFRMVLKTIGQVAPLVAGLVPHPVAKVVVGAVGSAANAAHQLIPNRAQRMLPADRQLAAAPQPAPAHKKRPQRERPKAPRRPGGR